MSPVTLGAAYAAAIIALTIGVAWLSLDHLADIVRAALELVVS